MSNIIDYVQWRGDIPLSASPFNEVDSLVLCVLSYLPFELVFVEGVSALTLGQAARTLLTAVEEGLPDDLLISSNECKLLEALRDSHRFSGMTLFGYQNDFDADKQIQFAAISALLGDNTCYLIYRGTDNTLVGWKEDFNMTFESVIPSQLEAVRYAHIIAEQTPCRLRLGGHSKGGNLAVYAAIHCDHAVGSRITRIYNNDGPGLNEMQIAHERYSSVRPLIISYLPQTSIIGMLLNHSEALEIVQSENSGLMQHDPFSWQVLGPQFVTRPHVTSSSLFFDQTLKGWLVAVPAPERRVFIDTLFELALATEARTVHQLLGNKRRSMSAVLSAFKQVEPETRKLLWRTLSALFSTGLTNLRRAPEEGMMLTVSIDEADAAIHELLAKSK